MNLTRKQDMGFDTPLLRRQRGAVLILVMLVLTVLIVVTLQIWFTTDTDLQISQFDHGSLPINKAAEGAFQQACTALLQDLQGEGMSDTGEENLGEEGTDGAEEGGDSTGGDDMGGGDMGGGFGAGMGEEGTQNTDSLVDLWARPGDVAMAFTSDVQVKILIRDEDAKFNLLSLLSSDDEFAEKSLERFARVVDLCREGTKGDLNFSQGEDIGEALIDWMKGDRGSDKFPKPLIKTGSKDKEKGDLFEDPFDFPLTMEELVLCEEITNDILFGYQEKGRRVPGLIEFVTIYSNLVLDEQKGDEEEEGLPEIDPEEEEDSEMGDKPSDESEDEERSEQEADPETLETNNGLINVNTAPLPVLKALMNDDEMSYSVLDEVDEFRQKAMEAYEKSLEDDFSGLDTGFEEDEEGEEGEDKEGEDVYDEEDEDFIFTDPYAVLERVEDYLEKDFNLEKDVEDEFGSLLTVTSNVFTIYLTVTSGDGLNTRNYRAVVWRRGGAGSMSGQIDSGAEGDSETGQIIILVPLELYSHPIPYREGEEEEIDEVLEEEESRL